jgi:AcrR family transcriptional regulator
VTSMARRTKEQTRRLLLDVGIRMLYEQGAHVGVTHIKLSEVAKAADLTTGAAYRCWEHQEAFHRDLAAEALRWRDRPPTSETVESITSLVETRAPLSEVIRVAAEANLFCYPADTPFLTTIALRACGPHDDRVAEASRERLDSAIEHFSKVYTVLAKLYGRRVRAPFTMTHIALTLAALSEGFALQAMSGATHPRVERSGLLKAADSDWTLFACAVEAIVDYFTEATADAADQP